MAFRDAYAAYCRPTDGLDGVTLAPFQILAAEGRALALTEPHPWHLAELARLDGDLITPTRHRFVDLSSAAGTGRGDAGGGSSSPTVGERAWSSSPPTSPSGRIQPGLKVRGREYLRIIYGPDYTDSLDVLRERHLGKKRQLAQREHGLGLEAAGRVRRRGSRCGRCTRRSSPSWRWSPSRSTRVSELLPVALT